MCPPLPSSIVSRLGPVCTRFLRPAGRQYDGVVGLKGPGRVAWTGVALAVLAAVLLAVVHSAPVESRVQAWLTVQVKRLWRLDLTATDLDYNLLTRRATLRGVTLSAEGHSGEPVFAARQVSVALPWAVFRGTLRLSSLVIDDGVVTLVRERGQIVNIPPSSGQPPPPVPRHLDLRGLSARNLNVNYVDRTGDIDVAVNGMQHRAVGDPRPGRRQRRRHHRGRERPRPRWRARDDQPAGAGPDGLRWQPRDPRSPHGAVPRGDGDCQRPDQPRARRHLVRSHPRGHARHGAAGRVGAAAGAGLGRRHASPAR